MSVMPSFQDYAHDKSECRPEWGFAWDGLAGLWVPRMGATGQTLWDLSGRGHHGMLIDMGLTTGWTVDEDGWALDFEADGNTDRVDCGDLMDGWTEFTFVTRVRHESVAADQDIIVKTDTHGANKPLVFWRDEATPDHYGILITDSGADYSGAKYSALTAPAAGVWIDIAVTFIGDDAVRMYFNGQPDANNPMDMSGVDDVAATADSFVIGNEGTPDGNQALDGLISYVLLYERALTDGEILALAREPLGLLVYQPRYYLWPEVAAVAANIQAISGVDRDDIQNLSSVPWADVEAVSSVSKD